MNTYQSDSAREWIWNHLDQKAFRTLSEEKLKAMIADFVQYDLHFMRISGVLNALDAPGEADYDEDEAFEFIYDAYLSDHPEDEDDDMLAATLLDRYMELQADYWEQSGLSD